MGVVKPCYYARNLHKAKSEKDFAAPRAPEVIWVIKKSKNLEKPEIVAEIALEIKNANP